MIKIMNHSDRTFKEVNILSDYFEDETGMSPDDLSKEDFIKLDDGLKWLAYENLLEMFYGAIAELEENS